MVSDEIVGTYVLNSSFVDVVMRSDQIVLDAETGAWMPVTRLVDGQRIVLPDPLLSGYIAFMGGEIRHDGMVFVMRVGHRSMMFGYECPECGRKYEVAGGGLRYSCPRCSGG